MDIRVYVVISDNKIVYGTTNELEAESHRLGMDDKGAKVASINVHV